MPKTTRFDEAAERRELRSIANTLAVAAERADAAIRRLQSTREHVAARTLSRSGDDIGACAEPAWLFVSTLDETSRDCRARARDLRSDAAKRRETPEQTERHRQLRRSADAEIAKYRAKHPLAYEPRVFMPVTLARSFAGALDTASVIIRELLSGKTPLDPKLARLAVKSYRTMGAILSSHADQSDPKRRQRQKAAA